jgi:hypothetical protein
MPARDGEFRRVIRLETVRSCPIVVGCGVLGGLAGYFDFNIYSAIILITDVHVDRLYGQVAR